MANCAVSSADDYYIGTSGPGCSGLAAPRILNGGLKP